MFSIQKGQFIQIIHVSNHWVVIALTKLSDKSEVFLYDSLQTSTINPVLAKQICQIKYSSDDELIIHSRPVNQQNNLRDCGVYAIAFAVDIA